MWFPDKRLQIVVISQQLGFISVRFLKIKLWWLWGPPDFSSCATTRFTVVALSENKYRMDCHEIRYGQSCPAHTQQQCQIQSQHNHPCCWISIEDITETERNKSSALRFRSVIVCMVRWWSSISHALCWKSVSPAYIITDAYIVTTEIHWDMLMTWQKSNHLQISVWTKWPLIHFISVKVNGGHVEMFCYGWPEIWSCIIHQDRNTI